MKDEKDYFSSMALQNPSKDLSKQGGLESSQLPSHLAWIVHVAVCVGACCSELRGFGGAVGQMCLYLLEVREEMSDNKWRSSATVY